MLFEIEIGEAERGTGSSWERYRVIARSMKDAIVKAEAQAAGDYSEEEHDVKLEAIEAKLISVADPIS